MNEKVQLYVVVVLVVIAAIYLTGYVVRQTRKGAKCEGCPIAGKCNERSCKDKCPRDDNQPPYRR